MVYGIWYMIYLVMFAEIDIAKEPYAFRREYAKGVEWSQLGTRHDDARAALKRALAMATTVPVQAYMFRWELMAAIFSPPLNLDSII